MKLQISIKKWFFCMNINIYVHINANHWVKHGFKVKCGISKLALCETQTKAISPSASYFEIHSSTSLIIDYWSIDVYGNQDGCNQSQEINRVAPHNISNIRNRKNGTKQKESQIFFKVSLTTQILVLSLKCTQSMIS